MFCEQCGEKLEDGAAFCTKCGAPVEPDSASAQQAGRPVQPVSQPVQQAGQPLQPAGQPARPAASQQQPSKGGSWHVPALIVCGIVIVALVAALAVVLPQSASEDAPETSAEQSAVAPQSDSAGSDAAQPSTDAQQQSGGSSYCAFNSATVTASSELQHDGNLNTSYYWASNVMDDDPETCWVEGAAGNGVGETITFTVPSASEVAGFNIRNGYQKSEEIYEHNARPHEMKVYADGEFVCTASLTDDSSGYQKVKFEQPVKAKSITLEIASVYEGTKWSDCGISDIKFFS